MASVPALALVSPLPTALARRLCRPDYHSLTLMPFDFHRFAGIPLAFRGEAVLIEQIVPIMAPFEYSVAFV